jgi:hypothetical protein
VYERPSLNKLLKLIWEKKPGAKRFALVSDTSPVSRGRVAKFNEWLALSLGKEGKVAQMHPVASWKEFKAALAQAQKSSDAIIVAGLGEESGGEGLKLPCPADLLKGITIPVVAVGGGEAANCLPIVVRLRPSAHALMALGMAGQILGGAVPDGIPTVTPDDMQVTVNER